MLQTQGPKVPFNVTYRFPSVAAGHIYGIISEWTLSPTELGGRILPIWEAKTAEDLCAHMCRANTIFVLNLL